MKLSGRQTKKCPRCGNLCLLSQVKCDDCGLLFSRVEEATNKAAKKRILRGDKDRIIFVKKCPSDIKKWKLILMVLFLGLFGGHYFYVGRWKWGVSMLCSFFAVLLVGVIFNGYFVGLWNGTFFSIFGPIVGVYTIIWLNDVRRVVFNSFKIPVSIITPQEEEEFQNEVLKKKEEKEKAKSLKKEIRTLKKKKTVEDKK